MTTIVLPYMLDFYPLQDEDNTRVHQFYASLREGKLTTTKCKDCGGLFWPPRVACPGCNSDQFEWVELPDEGELYAFMAMLLGAPLGMEKDVPFVLGMVQLDGTEFKVLSRIGNTKYEDCSLGMRVKLETYDLEDGRVWFRFVPITSD
ncbi:MAG: Zn-ribbon domain-containing OB-fold protein [Thermoplasmata archaeon]